MRIAITGGTGFVGRHLARRLAAGGVEVVIIARGTDTRDAAIRQLPGARFMAAAVDDTDALTRAFAGCDVVAHCAGINRQIGA
jgi:NADH dehydrogenase